MPEIGVGLEHLDEALRWIKRTATGEEGELRLGALGRRNNCSSAVCFAKIESDSRWAKYAW